MMTDDLTTQEAKRIYLIKKLLAEQQCSAEIPKKAGEQKRLLRSLFNIRPPRPAEADFIAVQDDYLQGEAQRRGIVEWTDLTPLEDQLYLWRGGITTLRCDAVVNAANSGMTGCYQPCHACIDNCIHTFAGVQMRMACARFMQKQGYEEPVGTAKITPGYNLPSKYVLHTVGPAISGRPTEKDCSLLASCYRSCLTLAEENDIRSVAFCCISTGVFHFPNEKAAQIAMKTVKEYLAETGSKMKVIFNVYKNEDDEIYRKLLGQRFEAEKGN